jgi:hypothetical protein
MPPRAPIPAPELLKEATGMLAQRGVDYDSKGGERSMAHAVSIFNTITKRYMEGPGEALTELEGWIFMMALKQARMMQGKPKRDTYVDLAAYTALAGECALTLNLEVEPTSGG